MDIQSDAEFDHAAIMEELDTARWRMGEAPERVLSATSSLLQPTSAYNQPQTFFPPPPLKFTFTPPPEPPLTRPNPPRSVSRNLALEDLSEMAAECQSSDSSDSSEEEYDCVPLRDRRGGKGLGKKQLYGRVPAQPPDEEKQLDLACEEDLETIVFQKAAHPPHRQTYNQALASTLLTGEPELAARRAEAALKCRRTEDQITDVGRQVRRLLHREMMLRTDLTAAQNVLATADKNLSVVRGTIHRCNINSVESGDCVSSDSPDSTETDSSDDDENEAIDDRIKKCRAARQARNEERRRRRMGIERARAKGHNKGTKLLGFTPTGKKRPLPEPEEPDPKPRPTNRPKRLRKKTQGVEPSIKVQELRALHTKNNGNLKFTRLYVKEDPHVARAGSPIWGVEFHFGSLAVGVLAGEDDKEKITEPYAAASADCPKFAALVLQSARNGGEDLKCATAVMRVALEDITQKKLDTEIKSNDRFVERPLLTFSRILEGLDSFEDFVELMKLTGHDDVCGNSFRVDVFKRLRKIIIENKDNKFTLLVSKTMARFENVRKFLCKYLTIADELARAEQ